MKCWRRGGHRDSPVAVQKSPRWKPSAPNRSRPIQEVAAADGRSTGTDHQFYRWIVHAANKSSERCRDITSVWFVWFVSPPTPDEGIEWVGRKQQRPVVVLFDSNARKLVVRDTSSRVLRTISLARRQPFSLVLAADTFLVVFKLPKEYDLVTLYPILITRLFKMYILYNILYDKYQFM